MTIDHAVALSLVPDLARRGLVERLKAGDPELLDTAERRRIEASAVRVRAASTGVFFVPWDAPEFPPALLAIPDCPPGLWYRGALDALAAPCVAVVGSRAGSPAALQTAAQLAADLAGHGVTVVSGLARGVDSAAHQGALRRGRTAAVLGSGLHCIYPREHAPLVTEIADRGVVLSEQPPDTTPLAFHFPLRNRIISGLSRAVVVIEASEKSGSLITAGCALEQGRDVMAVPGNVLGGRNSGGHALIRDGARIVETAAEVLVELGLYLQAGSARAGAASPAAADPILARMAPGHAYDLDALVEAAGLDPVRLLARLATLELEGHVGRAGGGRFIRTVRTC
jgi:DNA processing protein